MFNLFSLNKSNNFNITQLCRNYYCLWVFSGIFPFFDSFIGIKYSSNAFICILFLLNVNSYSEKQYYSLLNFIELRTKLNEKYEIHCFVNACQPMKRQTVYNFCILFFISTFFNYQISWNELANADLLQLLCVQISS